MDQEWMKQEPEDLPEHWEQTSRAFLQPLRAEGSELFVQKVMRKVRVYSQNEDWIRWPVFTRWPFPALALSIAGFTISLAYTLRPVPLSTETFPFEHHVPCLL